LQLEAAAHLQYASDTRGTHPYLPLMAHVAGACIQIPTTLPTLDELIGTDGLTAESVPGHLRALTQSRPATDQVFTAHAELEGGQLAPQFEALLKGWVADGFAIVPLRDVAASLDRSRLPRHEVEMGPIAGRSGVLALQGAPVAADA
jgi:undecaprenyl phosphate-alpha-L-ara4FN deformylase